MLRSLLKPQIFRDKGEGSYPLMIVRTTVTAAIVNVLTENDDMRIATTIAMTITCTTTSTITAVAASTIITVMQKGRRGKLSGILVTLRVQVPNNHMLAQNLYYNDLTQNPSTKLLGTWTLWVNEMEAELCPWLMRGLCLSLPSKLGPDDYHMTLILAFLHDSKYLLPSHILVF